VETVVDHEIEIWRSKGHAGRGHKESVSRHMHHKFAIVDGTTLLTGSFNYTFSASFANCENVLITDDTYHVRKYELEFERLWAEFQKSTASESRGEAAVRIQAIVRGCRGRDHAFDVLCTHPDAESLLAEGSERFKPLQKRRSLAKPPGL